ncbi:MAG TPA: ferrous iron transport protein A [Candidatus Sumerlaeota bacterium]|nr:ferrous iron transport protein A [Candidatus Sumerlaeota bacterium]HMX62131.1 ferrous iron transport protein A [Candidatus Sumerlaeota bacterium]HNM47648.1 ferrous iron transport protein A [Candidatus Sumerlaeota bacterium]
MPLTILACLRPGDQAVIEEITGDDALVQRLLEMGMTEGENIKVIRFAPLGDPIEIQIRGYNLSLRRADAAAVKVNTKA